MQSITFTGGVVNTHFGWRLNVQVLKPTVGQDGYHNIERTCQMQK